MDLERFVADCVAAAAEADAQAAVEAVLRRAIAAPEAVLKAVGEPVAAGLTTYHRSSSLTIFAAAWAPNMTLMPHDHDMWALIGLYTGREDNIFWRRNRDGLAAKGVAALFAGDVAALAPDAIHSVTNPLPRFTGGIHIYGGDFFATPRTMWDAETLAPGPSDGAVVEAIFARENARLTR